jgi:outer membrane receptor for ferric coprogen and ferric-rhodotorulic acid
MTRPEACWQASESGSEDQQSKKCRLLPTAISFFPALPEGDYEVIAELTGFESAHRTVPVRSAERTTISFTMQLAIVEQTIVTAARDGERDVQEVPMAVSVVSDTEIERLGITTVDQVAAFAPSVTFTQNSNFGQLSIRGIGTNAVYAGADPSSVMYLDGVYLARPAMAFAQFLDLDRIEVLRGPQGTLYGRKRRRWCGELDLKGPYQRLSELGTIHGRQFRHVSGSSSGKRTA